MSAATRERIGRELGVTFVRWTRGVSAVRTAGGRILVCARARATAAELERLARAARGRYSRRPRSA